MVRLGGRGHAIPTDERDPVEPDVARPPGPEARAGRHVPDGGDAVTASHGDAVVPGSKVERVDPRVHAEVRLEAAALHVPHPQPPLVATRRHAPTVEAEGQVRHLTRSGQAVEPVRIGPAPDLQSFPGAHGDAVAPRAPRDARDAPLVVEPRDLPAGRVVAHGGPVVGADCELGTVGVVRHAVGFCAAEVDRPKAPVEPALEVLPLPVAKLRRRVVEEASRGIGVLEPQRSLRRRDARHVLLEPRLHLLLREVPHVEGRARAQRRHGQQHGRREGPVPSNPGAKQVRGPRCARGDRPPLQVRAEVRREALDRHVPLSRVVRRGLPHDGLEVHGDSRIERAGTAWRRPGDVGQERHAILRGVRGSECQHLVERDPETVEVAPNVRRTTQTLRGEVAQGSRDGAGQRVLSPVGFLAEPEVGDPELPVRIEDQVRRLDVPVQHALRVRGRDPFRGLEKQAHDGVVVAPPGPARADPATRARRPRPPCRGAAPRAGPLEQTIGERVGEGVAAPRVALARKAPPQAREHGIEPTALDVLHRVVVDAVLLAVLDDRHDVGVVQPARGTRLGAESLRGARVERGAVRQHLERHAPVEGGLHRLVDDAHPTSADLAKENVVAEARPGRLADHVAPERLHPEKHGEELADVRGALGVTRREIKDRGSVALAVSRDELLCEAVELLGGVGVHASPASPRPSAHRASLRRRNART